MTAIPVRSLLTSLQYTGLESSFPTTRLACAFPTSLQSLMMRHLHLEHLVLDGLKKLLPLASRVVDRDADASIKTCLTCIWAKQQGAYNRKLVEKTTRLFDLVHSDPC